MSEDLDYEGKLVRESARRYLSECCPIATLRQHLESRTLGNLVRETWTDIAKQGWPSILLPEPGEHVADPGRAAVLSALAEELGSALYPGPVLSSAIVGHAVARRASDELRAEYLDPISNGAMTAAVVIHPDVSGRDGDQVTARQTPRGVALSGVLSAVPNGSDVQLVLVAARSDVGRVHVLVPTGLSGLHVAPLDSLDLTRSFARFEFTGTVVPGYAVLASDSAASRVTEDLMTLMACSETIGAAQRTFDFTLQYTQTRIAFGRPIGSFQVIKHRLVDMLLALESAKATVDAALAELGSDSAFGRHGAAIAKLYTSTKLPWLARECLQLHGGIGFTWEHDMHLYLRRIESNAVLWGSPDHLGDRLAPSIGLPDRLDRDLEVAR